MGIRNLRAGPQYLSEGDPALAPTTPTNWKDFKVSIQMGFFRILHDMHKTAKPEPPLFGMSRKSVLQPRPSEQRVVAAAPIQGVPAEVSARPPAILVF